MALLISTGDGMSTRMDLVALTLSSGSVRPEEYSMSCLYLLKQFYLMKRKCFR